MTDSKFDVWQKVVDDYCQTKNCVYYDDGVCNGSTPVGSCGVLKIKGILSGKIVVLDKADAIMAIIRGRCAICTADHKYINDRLCDRKEFCIYHDLKVVGEGKQ